MHLLVASDIAKYDFGALAKKGPKSHLYFSESRLAKKAASRPTHHAKSLQEMEPVIHVLLYSKLQEHKTFYRQL